MKKGVKILIGVVLSLGAISLLGYKYLSKQLDLLTNSCFRFRNFKFKKLTKTDVTLTINLFVKNMSNIAFTLKGYYFDVFINDMKVGVITKAVNQNIKGNEEVSNLSLDLSFNPTKIYKNNEQKIALLLSYALVNRDKFIIEFKGFVDVKQNVIIKKQDIDVKFSLTEILSNKDESSTSVGACKI